MNDSRKTTIARAFGAAAAGYDGAALAQRRIAARLGLRIAALYLPTAARAVEIGCGTGFLTERLLASQPQAAWEVTDIAAAMVSHCAARFAGRAVFRVMDGEAPDLAPASCDLITASMAVQWFTDLPGSLDRLAGCLKPGGRLVFATLGSDTFREWRAAHAEAGYNSGSLDFPSAAALQGLWPAGGRGSVREERLAVWHSDGRSFVRGLKDIGAHTPQPGHRPVPPGAFRQVLRRFSEGCRVTYHVLYGDYVRGGE